MYLARRRRALFAVVLCVSCALAWSTAALAQNAPPSPPAKESATAPPAGPEHDRVGFAVLGGVGFPQPLSIEALVDVHHVASFGVEYGALPTTNLYGANASMWALAADVRLFPLRNAFFIGLRAGRQHLGESASTTVTGIGTVSGSSAVDTTFLNPRLGFLWSWHALAFGIDAGVQVPVSSTSSSTLPAGITPPSGVAQLNQVLGGVLPTVDLLQIGVAL